MLDTNWIDPRAARSDCRGKIRIVENEKQAKNKETKL